MRTRKINIRFFIRLSLFLIIPLLLYSCEKEPGPGGKSTIYGKVQVREYNLTFTILEETYYGPGIWVYLVYGDDRDYSDRIQTGPGGVWEFRYLRPGNYKVYALSKDSTLTTNADIPVIREVVIPDGKQEVEVGEIVICN